MDQKSNHRVLGEGTAGNIDEVQPKWYIQIEHTLNIWINGCRVQIARASTWAPLQIVTDVIGRFPREQSERVPIQGFIMPRSNQVEYAK